MKRTLLLAALSLAALALVSPARDDPPQVVIEPKPLAGVLLNPANGCLAAAGLCLCGSMPARWQLHG